MKQRLKQLLSQRQVQHIIDSGRVPAAVLVPLFCREGQLYILFTKRTETVSTHKGQISFPGGAVERGDVTLLDASLREACEEIGLLAKDVEVLGELDDHRSVASNYLISPFVGFIPYPYQFTPSKEETERIIEVPVAALMERPPHKVPETAGGEAVTGYSYYYRGDVIWGATARILKDFLDILAMVDATGKCEGA